MLNDLSKSNDTSVWSKSHVSVAAAPSGYVDTVTVEAGYVASICWDFIVYDEVGAVMRAGEIRAAVTGGTQATNEVAHSIVEAPPLGTGIGISVMSNFNAETYLRVTNNGSSPLYVSFSAKMLVTPLYLGTPEIQLTLTGMPGGETFEGMGNGIHSLIPDFHIVSPIGQTDTRNDPYFGTKTIPTTSEAEQWRNGVPGTGTGDGMIAFSGWKTTVSGSSRAILKWKNGTSTPYGTVSYSKTSSTATTGQVAPYGFLRDQVLSNSWTAPNGTLFQWQRVTGKLSGAWGNY